MFAQRAVRDAQTENAGPKAGVFMFDVAGRLADDIRRLHQSRERDRCEQNEGNREAHDLGHLGFPLRCLSRC